MPTNVPLLKVALFSKYSRIGASTRLRSLQYLPELKNENIEVDVYPLFDDAYLQLLYETQQRSMILIIKAYLKRLLSFFRIFNYDLVWIEYELFPYLPAWLEQLLKFLGVNYIVDYDDAVFHNYDLATNIFIKKFLSKKIDKVMRSAQCVIGGNEYLNERAFKAGAQRVEIIPTVIDLQRYDLVPKPANNKVRIGWIGSPATQHYIVELKSVLEKIASKNNSNHHCQLVLVGAHPSVLESLKSIDVEVIPWHESTEVACIQTFDIGIMPLIDGPWEKGKCGYKLIQYMACALPVVASPVGVNVSLVNDSACGFLASDADAWLTHLQTLLSDESLRLTMGKKGRVAVENIYALQQQAPKLIKIIRESIH